MKPTSVSATFLNDADMLGIGCEPPNDQRCLPARILLGTLWTRFDTGRFPSKDKQSCNEHRQCDPAIDDGHSAAAPPPIVHVGGVGGDEGIGFDPENPAH